MEKIQRERERCEGKRVEWNECRERERDEGKIDRDQSVRETELRDM